MAGYDVYIFIDILYSREKCVLCVFITERGRRICAYFCAVKMTAYSPYGARTSIPCAK